MSAAIAIPVTEELFREVSQHANHAGVSPEEWAAKVLAERIRIERQTEEFFRLRAARASGKSLGELLDKVPNRPPDPGDEIPPDVYTMEGAQEYFRRRAAGATGDSLQRALDAVPSRTPDPGDEL